jgi:hypothetical protein
MDNINFEKNVFINCPFDKDFLPLLNALLFTVLRCGLNPRIALERFDSGETRFDKIKELIETSRFSIHDLSRIKSSKKGEYYRMNMPFEIGLDLGCRLYHLDEKYRSKKSLILEKERYSYQKALSDISNSDIKCHNGNVEELVEEVRNWFYEIGLKELKGKSGGFLWDEYNEFLTDFYEKRHLEGYKMKDIEKMPIPEYIDFIRDWLSKK